MEYKKLEVCFSLELLMFYAIGFKARKSKDLHYIKQ